MRRLIGQVVPIVLGVVVMSVGVLAQSQKFGGPVNVATATTVSELHASPEKFVGKTVRVDGLVTSVCTGDGCWVAVKDGRTDQTVRFQAEHDRSIVFPITLKGKAGSFQGVFTKIGANTPEAKEAAEHAHAEGKTVDFASKYEIKVTGAVIGEK
jgi:hypothetical protein